MYFRGESLCGGCNLASGSLGVGWGFQESWKNYMETGPAGKMSLRQLVNIQRSLLLRLKNSASWWARNQAKQMRGPVWIIKELLSLIRHKKETHRRWKWGWATWTEYRNVNRTSKNETRRVRANLELILAKDVRNKKVFFKYINSKRKTKDNVGLLLNGGGSW